MRDVFPPSHWAVRGEPPAFDTPDEDVYLRREKRHPAVEGRGLHAVQACAQSRSRLLLGTLAGNPFPDATAAFFAAMSRALSLGLGAPIAIEAPFAALHKADVIRKGIELGVPLELTLSCMQPKDGLHCGAAASAGSGEMRLERRGARSNFVPTHTDSVNGPTGTAQRSQRSRRH